MSRRETTLDPAVAAELAELERALAGEPSPFTALVADVRAERPVMAPAFAAKLDGRVDEARAAPPRRSWVAWSSASGLAAALVVAVVIVSNRDGGSSSTVSSSQAGSSAATSVEDSSAKAFAPQSAAGGATSPAARKVERSTSLELSTSRADVQGVADDVIATSQRFGGIVESSQIATSDAEASAVFSLRIPTKRLDEAVAALSKLAHVASLSQGSTDITGSFVSVSSRLGDARAERRGLLKALGRATTAQEIDALKARLRDNRSQIAVLKGELNGLRRRADLARVDVNVSGNGQKGATGGGNWTPRDAAHDALRVLEVAAGVLLVGLAAGIPLLLIAALGALAARSARRRRREGALDPV
jgi:hypothetical protein